MMKILLNGSVPAKCFQRSIQLLICWLILTPLSVKADLLVAPEYEVKMGFIFNFINFVTWPPEAVDEEDPTITFCFSSDHPAANVLFKLNGQSIRGRKLKVQKVESELETQNCHILFFGTNNRSYIRRSIASISGKNILTIGEVKDFGRLGGIVNFFNQNNKLRFEVNIDAAKREKLKLGAGLLQSAQKIIKETEEDRKAQIAEITRYKEELKQKTEAAATATATETQTDTDVTTETSTSDQSDETSTDNGPSNGLEQQSEHNATVEE